MTEKSGLFVMKQLPNGSLLPRTILLCLPTQFRIKYEMKKLQIRNSTADFLVFTKENNSADTIEVRVQDGNVWLTQKAIGQLFDIDRSVVTKHLQNVFCRW